MIWLAIYIATGTAILVFTYVRRPSMRHHPEETDGWSPLAQNASWVLAGLLLIMLWPIPVVGALTGYGDKRE